jgi:hypothetical protein
MTVFSRKAPKNQDTLIALDSHKELFVLRRYNERAIVKFDSQ